MDGSTVAVREAGPARYCLSCSGPIELTDPLTGLADRRTFHARLEEALARPGTPELALMLIDLDRFKSVNDTHGHVMGDAVLRAAADALEPDEDTLAIRLGGEEFLLLLRGTDVATRAERRRQAIAVRVASRMPGLDRVVTASMGLVEQPAGARVLTDFKAFYGHCDRLLYEAKHAGRNRTMSERIQGFAGGRASRAA